MKTAIGTLLAAATLPLFAAPDAARAVSPDGRNEIRRAGDALEIVRDGKTLATVAAALDADGATPKLELLARNDGVAYRWRFERFGTSRRDAETQREDSFRQDSKTGLTGLPKTPNPVNPVSKSCLNDLQNLCDSASLREDSNLLIRDERADVTFASPDQTLWIQHSNGNWRGDPLQNSWEHVAERFAVKVLSTNAVDLYFAPVLAVGDGWAMAVTESDLHDYAGWNFRRDAARPDTLAGVFAKWPAKTLGGDHEEVTDDPRPLRKKRVMSRAPFIVARATGEMTGWGEDSQDFSRVERGETCKDSSCSTRSTRLISSTLPWRVFMLADAPVGLIGNTMVDDLAAPNAIGDASWVKPGKVAWDWWNDFDNQGEKGLTTATYARFIDFAASNGVEYVILDEGWSEHLNIWKVQKDIDLEGLIAHADARGVGLVLWMAWAQADGQEERVAAHFAKMGVKGFKVDFMDRDDAQVVRFLERFAAACARHRLLVDYHGVFKPTGLHVTYPNIVNYEGVFGLEQMKWDATTDMMANDCSLPFVRGLAGPMDYTPGAMDNYTRAAFRPSIQDPGSQGTRAHQVALMSLLCGPLQMLCDAPTKYEREAESFAYMAAVPTVWDETRGLAGEVGRYVVEARRAGDVWYLAAICDWSGLSCDVSLDFLPEGAYTAEIFADAPDAAQAPTHYVHDSRPVTRATTLPLRLAPGGGFSARLAPTP